MLKDLILKQKQIKEELSLQNYVSRDKMVDAKEWIDTKMIKVILGPRRAGKSIFALNMLKDRNFAYFNFDEEGLPEFTGNVYEEFLQELRGVYSQTKIILLDEIQNLPRWELFANRLHRENYNLTVTGSNSKLLSQELATALTGRHIPIEIMPFNFKEFRRAGNKFLDDYLVDGGYPEVVTDNFNPKSYHSILYDSILFKDVVKRHRIRYGENLDGLSAFLINNFSGTYTSRRLKNLLNFNSDMTVSTYLNYLSEAYLFFSLKCFSPKAGQRSRLPEKIYVVDNGFIKAKAVQVSPDYGKLMENLVFTELIKRGFKLNRELFYYRTRNGREVDFVLKKGLKVGELIQVCYDLSNPETKKREMKALLEAAEELGTEKLTIINWNKDEPLSQNNKTINLVPLEKWLTSF